MRLFQKCRYSITWRFTCIFVGVISFFLLAVIGANTFLLERYYAKEKVRVLENAYLTVDSMIRQADGSGEGVEALFPEDYSAGDSATETAATRYIRSLTESGNISVIIVDTKTDHSFTSAVNSDFLMKRLAASIFGNRGQGGRLLRRFENYSIEQSLDRSGGGGYLESWGYFSDNTTSFIMSMPMSSLREPVAFFNRFLLLLGIFALLLSTVIVYLTSRQMTKPINALARLSERMSKLDFSARYCGASEDELGTLGHAMNEMSERLEKTIAELKTANNELQSDIENKRRIDERRQEFVANVSHELKTPIALIQGYAEGLMDGLAEEPESRDYYCGVIVDEAKKMNRMVRELMNLSAIEQGKELPEFSLFPLRRIVEEVLSSSRLVLEQKGAKLEVDIPEDLKVWADPFQLEEVVTNYLSNALNHLEEPNQISIYTEKEGEEKISLHVMNTGRQIPEESLGHIWEKFYKVDKAHTRSYGGSGIGLSIVKAIADAHHQSCGVKNTRTGVNFWFTLDREKSGRAVRN